AEDGIRARNVTGVQTCALPISVCLIQPFRFPLGNALLGAALAAGVTLVFFASAKITLAFSRTAPALRRLPVELLAMGIVWMVLRSDERRVGREGGGGWGAGGAG